MASTRRTLAYGLTANVVILGVVSLFTDISSEMILPILPFFLIQVLGANALIVGLEEGFSDSVVSFMKIFSGWFSDAAGKRKRFVGAGYALSTLMKVLFPFAQSWPEFVGMRIVERTGKGVRDAPRDALLTESTPAETRGKAFGFHRAMDTTGAVLGPILTLVLLAALLPSMGLGSTYRLIILIAAVPAAVSFACVFLVREPSRVASRTPRFRASLRSIPRSLTLFIGIASVFSFADFSFAFLLLRVMDVGWTTVVAILLYILFNIVYAAHAFPAGILSDHVGRRPVILVGYGFFIAMAVLIAGLPSAVAGVPPMAPTLAVLAVGFVLYGLSYGMAEGTQRALVADLAPPESKATVLGAYHTSMGFVKLASGIVAGALWVFIAPAATFVFGAITASVAAVLLLLWHPPATSAASGRGPARPA